MSYHPVVTSEEHGAVKVPTVSIIVLNWNGYDDTEQCVRSLQQLSYPAVEVILVDNNSTDGSAARLSAAFPGMKLLQLAENRGYSAGNNAGLREALASGSDYVLILNNDTVVDKDFLQPLLAAFEVDARVGIATPKVYYLSKPDMIYSAGGRYSRWLCSGVGNDNGLLDSESGSAKKSNQDISFAPGCALMVKVEVFQTVGLFDERFFMYFEDLDFSKRVLTRYKIVYVPSSRIFHKVGAGVRWSNYTPLYLYYYTRNRLWFFKNESLLLRIYSFLFSVFNTLAKSAVIMMSPSSTSTITTRSTQRNKQLSALWRGLLDGLRQKKERSKA